MSVSSVWKQCPHLADQLQKELLLKVWAGPVVPLGVVRWCVVWCGAVWWRRHSCRRAVRWCAVAVVCGDVR